MTLSELFELQRGNFELHRIVTCHFVHWTHEQLAWDALAFIALAIACGRRDRRAFHATLLASIVLIPLAVLAFAPEVVAYRGLSGLASAMFALLLMLELTVILSAAKDPLRMHASRRAAGGPSPSLRLGMTVLFAIGFAAKITFEAITGGTVFVNTMGSEVVSVPVAHVAGALIGVIGGMRKRKRALVLAPLLLTACVTTAHHGSDLITPPRNCAGGALAGAWRSSRTSALGPAWATITLRADCRFTVRVQLLFARHLEHGFYEVENDRIRFHRGDVDTIWAYRRKPGYLMLEEAPGEWHPYTFSPCGFCSS